MPPKPKDVKKPSPNVPRVRLPISESSLVKVPDDAIEGYQERTEQGIHWTPLEAGGRHHKFLCLREDIPYLPFTEALKNKIKNSYLNGFINEDSGLSLEEQWELSLPITLWENENCSNEEGKICFRSANSITDSMIPMIAKAVRANNRDIIKDELKSVDVLRVNDSEMTHLDKGLLEYSKLITINLCGNFLDGLDGSYIPESVRAIELQANCIKSLDSFADLPPDILYLGLSRNLLDNASVEGVTTLPQQILVLDLSENDIYELLPLLDKLAIMPNLTSLTLAGNPCSVCAAYARTTLTRLPNLEWLDNRKVLETDRPEVEPIFEPHLDDLRSAYFNFSIFRVMSVPTPPKPTEKGTVLTFHVEVELPLLDSTRRQFLMLRRNESLIQMLPPPEDEWESQYSMKIETVDDSGMGSEISSEESDIYAHLAPKNSRIIRNYTVYESNKVPWNKIMNFQEPAVRIFCPDLVALRNTFRTFITVRLIFTQYIPPPKPAKVDKKSDKKTASSPQKPVASEQTVTMFTVKCPLRRLDWSQPSQHFHWDETLGSDEAIHWGDGDLSILQYSLTPVKTVKGKVDTDAAGLKQIVPEVMTAHFGFSVDTIRP